MQKCNGLTVFTNKIYQLCLHRAEFNKAQKRVCSLSPFRMTSWIIIMRVNTNNAVTIQKSRATNIEVERC